MWLAYMASLRRPLLLDMEKLGEGASKCGVLARVFGTSFAEMPFVATKEGYRHAGNLGRLMQVLTHAGADSCRC